MKEKISNPQAYTSNPMAGVGVMSGFGIPEKPPSYNLDKDKKAIPRGDTHPGTGINYLKGKVKDPDPETMLGEGD